MALRVGLETDERFFVAVSANGDDDHGLRDVDALLAVAHHASPPGTQPKVRSAASGAAGLASALLVVGSVDDLGDEVEIGGLTMGLSRSPRRRSILDPGKRLRTPASLSVRRPCRPASG
ncbi:hypothetical protein MES4922_10260 [Mesorhizobium ventifaucium]|uniref:Uncharacterized protein n=1 Tax=Mesorhizobium ventifaucium TaxID=666020 RepID=A0ABN8J867_9HYPH|nr:hypothetical protein MES4922_10260 [Mesorhizobium ventifaucium]